MLVGVVFISQPVAATSPLYVGVSGPTVMAVKDKQQFTIDAIGGPAEEGLGNYSYTARIVGSPKGASALPTSGSSADGMFRINVTAPENPMYFTFRVNVTSGEGQQSVWRVVEYTVRAINPIVISANIHNTGSVDVQGVPVSVYADGRLLHKAELSIKAKSTHTFIYNWTDPDIRDGKHEVSIVLDPDKEFLTFEGGGAVYSTTIYVGEQGSSTLDIVLGVMLGLLIFLTIALYRRPKKRRKK